MKSTCALFFALGVLAVAGSASAAPVFMGGGATITHTGNLGGVGDTRIISVPAVPSIGVGGTIPLQYSPSTAIINGTARSSGRAGIAAITGPSTFGFAFAPTTNLTQSGNLNTSPATASTLRIDFNGAFLIQGSDFGTGNLAGFTISIVANVPNSRSAFTQVTTGATFQIGGGEDIRAPIPDGSVLYFRNLPGSEIATRSNTTGTVPDPISAGLIINIAGAITFTVHNDNDEASIELVDFGGVAGLNQGEIPAPGAAGLLGLAGLVATRRRR